MDAETKQVFHAQGEVRDKSVEILYFFYLSNIMIIKLIIRLKVSFI